MQTEKQSIVASILPTGIWRFADYFEPLWRDEYRPASHALLADWLHEHINCTTASIEVPGHELKAGHPHVWVFDHDEIEWVDDD